MSIMSISMLIGIGVQTSPDPALQPRLNCGVSVWWQTTPASDVMPGLAIFPDSPLPLYDQPLGGKIGIASRAPNQWDILIQRGPSEPISALPNDSKEVGL